jgi:hypothetical protein
MPLRYFSDKLTLEEFFYSRVRMTRYASFDVGSQNETHISFQAGSRNSPDTPETKRVRLIQQDEARKQIFRALLLLRFSKNQDLDGTVVNISIALE